MGSISEVHRSLSVKKTIGVLGGMGPEATAYFFKRIVELTPAKADQEHLRIIIDNNPKIPDRTEAILGRGDDPLPEMIKTIENLERAGAELIAIPCNSAHFYFDQLQKATRVPLINLIKEVVAEVTRLRVKRAGLLATTGTVKAGLYHRGFRGKGIKLLLPNEDEQEQVMSVIRCIKKGGLPRERLKNVVEGLISRGGEVLILGCTELSLIAPNIHWGVPIVDSLEVLAKATVKKAGRENV